MENKIYFCIDMKSFYASVECAERQLNPMTTKLVVADVSHGKNALCLAVSPKLKSLGVRNRCRLSEIPNGIEYEIAKPRMRLYIEYCADIYDIYLDYISPEDIHVYSVDECFIDATNYLKMYKLTAKQFAKKLVDEIALRKHIPATVGIGTNLYLAKIALDITAKKAPDHMGYLDEETYRKTLWNHQPITDFWNIANGKAKRLATYGIVDMEGITQANEHLLYKLFGKNYLILLDHAWGKESCTIADIKAYKSKTHSVSNSQILFEDYDREKAKVVLLEMALNQCQEMMRKKVITHSIGIYVGYSKDCCQSTGGTIKMPVTTNVYSVIKEYVSKLYEETTEYGVPIRRLGISYNSVVDEICEGYDIFTLETSHIIQYSS